MLREASLGMSQKCFSRLAEHPNVAGLRMVHTVAALAMKGRQAVDFCGYWQRHVQN
jgi:hypothetical protein